MSLGAPPQLAIGAMPRLFSSARRLSEGWQGAIWVMVSAINRFSSFQVLPGDITFMVATLYFLGVGAFAPNMNSNSDICLCGVMPIFLATLLEMYDLFDPVSKRHLVLIGLLSFKDEIVRTPVGDKQGLLSAATLTLFRFLHKHSW